MHIICPAPVFSQLGLASLSWAHLHLSCFQVTCCPDWELGHVKLNFVFVLFCSVLLWISQAGLELEAVFLSQSSKCWDYKNVPPYPTQVKFKGDWKCHNRQMCYLGVSFIIYCCFSGKCKADFLGASTMLCLQTWKNMPFAETKRLFLIMCSVVNMYS